MLCEVTSELGVCLIYKNASSSLRAARPMRPVRAAEFLSLPRRVALLREPHDRFEATWRDFRQRRGVRLTFPEFAEAAFADAFPFKTPELLPQVDQCGLANHLVRWDFSALAQLLGVPLPRLNTTVREPAGWPAEIERAFAQRYAADLALWEQRTPPPSGPPTSSPAPPPEPLHRY
jgi:hypothetical protein